ncbi:MAG TPA: RodZ domain-containing protein [Solirubrobacteraceae bacterium]|nr:RodZ domain-containing protein [Solirubrobacteraceae bacterium]
MAAPASAGALLRAAREAAGMSIDAVAQQLKLAPRQVKALEDGDFTHLPGRTFVRGFMRNYARLVRLDPEVVLGALPVPTVAPTLDAPALHATAQTMGELPTTEAPRHGWTRWAIPLTLVAIIAATAAWEWTHPAGDGTRITSRATLSPSERDVPASHAAEAVGTPLPNPVAPAMQQEPEAAAAPESAGAEKTPVAAGAPVTAPAAQDAPVTEAATGTPRPAAAAVPEAPLTLAFRDFSWTEVKERSGRVLLAQMNPGGTTQALAGSPPLDVVIGNASDVTLTWKGKRIDLAPYTRQNIARLTLE